MIPGMEKPSRDFKGIWIPKDIWESRQLSAMEKVLFVEIHSLDNEDGCYAGNKYFANFFKVSERQIRNYIASLKEKGFISVSIFNLNERVIHAIGRYARVPDAKVKQLQQEHKNLVRKLTWGNRGGGKFTSRG
jgi:hypothetical protein